MTNLPSMLCRDGPHAISVAAELWSIMKATVNAHGLLSLRLFFWFPDTSVMDVVSMFVVVQVVGLCLDAVPRRLLTQAWRQWRSQSTHFAPRESIWWAWFGWVTARPRWLAAGSLHDSLDVIIEDALRVLLMSISHERTSVVEVNTAGVAILRINTRWKPVTE